MAAALVNLGGGWGRYVSQDGQPVVAVEWCGRLTPGLHVGVYYPSDPGFWHERVLLWPASGDAVPRHWYVVTPDSDVYAEGMASGLGWGSRFAILDNTGGNPVIQVSAPASLMYLQREGQEMPLGDVVPLPPAPPAAASEAAVDAADAAGALAGAAPGWPCRVSLETVPGQIARDDEVTLHETALIDDDRAIDVLPSGKRIAVRLTDLPVEPLHDDTGLGDARTLGPLRCDSHGGRHLDYRAGTLELREEALDAFPLKGERSILWLQRYISEHGGTPDGRHTKYLTEEALPADSTAGHLHDDLLGLSMFLSVVYDQVDGSNLACMEVAARCYQLVEETKGSMRTEGLEYYVGRDQGGATRRGIAMAPALARHATDLLAKEVEIAKQRRKFREEQAAKRGGGSNSNNNNKNKDKIKDKHKEKDKTIEALNFMAGYPSVELGTSVTPLRSYVRHMVSWPDVGNRPGLLVDRLTSRDQSLVLPQSVFEEVIKAEQRPLVYMDPGPNNHANASHEFARDGLARECFRVGRRRREDVTVFFVANKDGGLRLALDCPRSNQRLTRPDPAALFSGASFGDFEVDAGESAWFGGLDVKSAFYQHRLPAYLCDYSCLSRVRAGAVGVTHVLGRPVDPWDFVCPQMAVVPMGWSWGLYMVQRAHEYALDVHPSFSSCWRAVDFGPRPSVQDGPARSPYVDNVLLVGTRASDVTERRREASAAFTSQGLAVHCEEGATQDMDMLDVRLTGLPPTAQLTEKWFWRLFYGIQCLVDARRRATSSEIKHLIVHCSFCALVRREALAGFCSVCAFI
ncbi:unnamed protein product, partial [Prorocentrum cordatum]